MSKNTALGAEKMMNEHMTFNGTEHKKFYLTYLHQCRREDPYHKALIYCLGISQDTRQYIDEIYDFFTGCVNTKCLTSSWITSGGERIIRLAFNLYCNGVPSLYDMEDENIEIQLAECKKYTVENIFYSVYAPYFWQAIQIRYPECCG